MPKNYWVPHHEETTAGKWLATSGWSVGKIGNRHGLTRYLASADGTLRVFDTKDEAHAAACAEPVKSKAWGFHQSEWRSVP